MALDIKGELIFMLLFLAAIIIPQVMSYFLSGISGCASSPIFVSKGFSIFIWTMAKAFATCSAIILSLCLLGALGHIPLGLGEIITSLYTGLAMLFFAFSMMFFYRKSEYLQELAMDYLINKSNVLTKMHRWLARKNIA
ncbi:hypothetical protein RN02_12515 [Pseudomonas sp. PI1]|nr:hypothetical protein RN02_12515 [Pseudomonas sp. PI1]